MLVEGDCTPCWPQAELCCFHSCRGTSRFAPPGLPFLSVPFPVRKLVLFFFFFPNFGWQIWLSGLFRAEQLGCPSKTAVPSGEPSNRITEMEKSDSSLQKVLVHFKGKPRMDNLLNTWVAIVLLLATNGTLDLPEVELFVQVFYFSKKDTRSILCVEWAGGFRPISVLCMEAQVQPRCISGSPPSSVDIIWDLQNIQMVWL